MPFNVVLAHTDATTMDIVLGVPTARAAMRHYFATGGLAPFVRWVAF